MVTREEIEEGLENLGLHHYNGRIDYLRKEDIGDILSYLHSQGVVIKVEDATFEWTDGRVEVFGIKYEPLVKEE